MERPKATIITDKPIVFAMGQMELIPEGVLGMAEWIRQYRPSCVPEGGFHDVYDLLPHGAVEPDPFTGKTRPLTDNEILCELAGRKCFDANTEVLTPSGWVKFSELQRGVEVATLNRQDDVIEFQKPTDYIDKQYYGEMYCVESRAFSIRVTADHDMFVQRGRAPWTFVPAGELLGQQFSMRRCAPLQSSRAANKPKLDLWARLVGYYISEGSYVDGKKYGCGSRVVLYQRPESAGPILETLAALGHQPYLKTDPRNGCLHIVVNDTGLAGELAALCGDHSLSKHIPIDALQWPASAREALLDALMYGDGTETDGARVYTTISKRLADEVQTLIMLSGRPGSISSIAPNTGTETSFAGRHRVYRVREGSQKIASVNMHDRHDHFEPTRNERVFCVTVPNRILVLRRNDKIFMASNCYDSFAEAGAARSNFEYLASMWTGRDVVHRSTGYHAKMTFFFAHVSRRVSHEFIRNYVGSDRNEEGSPSQESTRFTHHPGTYIAHPYVLQEHMVYELGRFEYLAQQNYEAYVDTIQRKVEGFTRLNGKKPTGLDKKRIYESSAGDLLMSCGTSWIWTTNPMALTKFFHERCDDASDMEMSRFAKTVKEISLKRWPNLFPDFVEPK